MSDATATMPAIDLSTENTTDETSGDNLIKYIAYNRAGAAIGEVWAADLDEALNAASQQYDATASVRPEGEPAPEPVKEEPAVEISKPRLHTPDTAGASAPPETKVPKVGKGGPLAWFKNMAMRNGDHPRVLATAKPLLEQAGVKTEDLTEDLLREATKLCLPAAKSWAERMKKAGQHVEINEKEWFSVGESKAPQKVSTTPEKKQNSTVKISTGSRLAPRENPTPADLGQTPKRQKVLTYLLGRKATSGSSAIPISDVYKNAGGMAVVSAMILAGHVSKASGEEGVSVFITTLGKAAIAGS